MAPIAGMCNPQSPLSFTGACLNQRRGFELSLSIISRPIPMNAPSFASVFIQSSTSNLYVKPRSKNNLEQIHEALRQVKIQKTLTSHKTTEHQKFKYQNGFSSVHRRATAAVRRRTTRHAAHPREELPTTGSAPTTISPTTISPTAHAAKHLRKRHSSGLIAARSRASGLPNVQSQTDDESRVRFWWHYAVSLLITGNRKFMS
jgi:hypothetical protein